MKIYDNSNLAESYSGVTSPLTYSFARYVYQEVYRHFCGMMGVRKPVIRQNEALFQSMLAFIGYRMYYDLVQWHKLVSFLPGYKYNRGFFEKMLGVEKEYRGLIPYKHSLLRRYFLYLPRLLFQSVKILYSFARMKRLTNQFNNHFDGILADADRIDLTRLNLAELRDLYYSLMTKLLFPWRIPIANDFAVMVSTGIIHHVFARWLREANISPYLNSLAHRSLITLDPGLELFKIADAIRGHPLMCDLFSRQDEPIQIYQELQNRYRDHEITRCINDYIRKYGDRPPNELKLETETIGENPAILAALIVNLVRSGRSLDSKNMNSRNPLPAEFRQLSLPKQRCIGFLLRWARNSIERREETRFRRALIFGFARKIFIQIGKKFQEMDLLRDFRDVFYLEEAEIFACIQNSESSGGLRELAEKRKAEMQQWKSIDLPKRIEASESIDEIERNFVDAVAPRRTDSNPPVLKGMVVAKAGGNKVSGIALVLSEFDSRAEFQNKILVTRQTDPGWTIVFPSLTAIVVERGGMLSHAAIVARELRIPCIVGVADAVARVRSGDYLNLDLHKGEVHVAGAD